VENENISIDLMRRILAHEISHSLGLSHVWNDYNTNDTAEKKRNAKNNLNSQKNPDERFRRNPGEELYPDQLKKIEEYLTKNNRDGKDC
jgi:hypothetical protein